MDAASHLLGEGGVHDPVTLDAGPIPEVLGDDPHAEVTAPARRTGMPPSLRMTQPIGPRKSWSFPIHETLTS